MEEEEEEEEHYYMEKELKPQITDNSRTVLVLKSVVIECVNP